MKSFHFTVVSYSQNKVQNQFSLSSLSQMQLNESWAPAETEKHKNNNNNMFKCLLINRLTIPGPDIYVWHLGKTLGFYNLGSTVDWEAGIHNIVKQDVWIITISQYANATAPGHAH